MAYISQQSIGSQLFRFDEIPSTNDKLRELAEQNVAVHGAVAVTGYQTRGRGQTGNTWESESASNLLLSVFVVPPSLSADEQVYLNLFACLSVFDFIHAYSPGRTTIKWPNDIYIDDKKIAGILIENNLQGSAIKNSIIGVGININQQHFIAEQAISLSLLKKRTLDLDTCMNQLIDAMNKRYEELSLHLKYKLMEDYHRVLYRKDVKALYSTGDEIIEGEILGIDHSGRLKIKAGNETRLFNFKEIAYL